MLEDELSYSPASPPTMLGCTLSTEDLVMAVGKSPNLLLRRPQNLSTTLVSSRCIASIRNAGSVGRPLHNNLGDQLHNVFDGDTKWAPLAFYANGVMRSYSPAQLPWELSSVNLRPPALPSLSSGNVVNVHVWNACSVGAVGVG